MQNSKHNYMPKCIQNTLQITNTTKVFTCKIHCKILNMYLKYYLWPPCEADADIIFCPVVSFYLSIFFIPRLISAVADWMSTILRHMMRPWCELRMHVWNAKNRRLGTIVQLCRAKSTQLRHILTIGRKFVKQQYVLHMSSQYGELRPTSGWDRFVSLGHPR